MYGNLGNIITVLCSVPCSHMCLYKFIIFLLLDVIGCPPNDEREWYIFKIIIYLIIRVTFREKFIMHEK